MARCADVDQWLEWSILDIDLPAAAWLYPIKGIIQNNPAATTKAKQRRNSLEKTVRKQRKDFEKTVKTTGKDTNKQIQAQVNDVSKLAQQAQTDVTKLAQEQGKKAQDLVNKVTEQVTSLV